MRKITILIFIIVMSLTNVLAYDTYYIVKQDGTGDFTEIQDAIDAVSNGTSAIIYVYGSIIPYSGADNTNLHWNGDNKNIYMYGVNSPQIDCDGQHRAFSLLHTTEEDIIEGFVIYDAFDNSSFSGGAIRVKDGCLKILNNTFDNCSDGSYSEGYVMSGANWNSSKGGAIFIEHDNDNQTSEISGNSFNECVAFYGGAICIEEGYCLIEDNEFNDNHACYNEIGTGNNGKGGVIYLDSSEADILNNTFTSNSSPELGIIVSGASEVSGNVFDGNYRGDWYALSDCTYLVTCNTFKNNIVKNHSIQGYNSYSLFYTPSTNQNNTFISNSVPLSFPYSYFPYSNCIFINNSYEYGFFGDEDLDYCLIYNSGSTSGTTMTNCITETDPQIHATTSQPLWTSSIKSPCIDTGNPNSDLDPDGSRADMGAVHAAWHKYDVVDLPSPSIDNGIKWLSFPALDDVYSTHTYDPDKAGDLLFDILDPINNPELDYVLDENGGYVYIEDEEWQGIENIFSKTEGYIFKMNEAAILEISGFKISDNAHIQLDGNSYENWIGYWLEESQTLSDAFGDEWENGNIYSIKHQDWSAYYSEGSWQYKTTWETDDPPTLSYADMVKVKCHNTISSFCWDNSTPEDSKSTFAEPEYYSFEEQIDYTPLFVELDETDLPQEIGAFVNGECIGATVVESALTQINAYTTSASPGDIELEFYYGSRSMMQNKTIATYRCVSSDNPARIQQSLNSGDYAEAWFVSLREDSSIIPSAIKLTLSNYPNPFNPDTTIFYNIPQDGKVSLEIYNIKGQLVKHIVSGFQLEGNYEVVWNGKDDSGKQVSSGVYYSRLQTCGRTINKKMLLLK